MAGKDYEQKITNINRNNSDYFLLTGLIYPYIEMEFASSAYYTQDDKKI